MTAKTSKPGTIHQRIVDVLKRHPEGVSGGQIRQELEKEGLRPEEQTHVGAADKTGSIPAISSAKDRGEMDAEGY